MTEDIIGELDDSRVSMERYPSNDYDDSMLWWFHWLKKKVKND